MGRISQEEISELKSSVLLAQLVEGSGVELKRHGKDLIGCCPFHNDRTPSLVITEDKNLWHCLGACQTGGSVIDWVMKKENVSFRHAVELLRGKVPSLAAKDEALEKVALPTLLTVDADNQAALQQVIDYYHATLKQSPEALEYLSQRGLKHPELIDRFKLGYANRTLGYRLPSRLVKAGAKLRGQLQQLGILRTSGHEHFSGSLVIPIINEEGMITEVYGRKILGIKLRKGTPIHTYLPGPHQGVFNIAAFKSYKEIILCESLIDALSFYAAGFYNVTTSYGVSGFTADILEAFKNHDIEKVSIAYDRDEAGDAAAKKVTDTLSALGIDCFRVVFPKDMDVNAYACQVKPASESLGVLLRKAQWLTNGSNKKPKPVLEVEPEVTAKITEQEVIITQEDRYYRVRGLYKNMSYEQLKINLLIKCKDKFHVDSLDIYSARHRSSYVKQASLEIGVKEELIKQDLGKVLLKLEELQDKQIQGILAKEDKKPKLSDSELKEALSFLESPDLLQTIMSDFEQLGIVGEKTNKLVGYLAATSRKLDKPLAVMVQSSSAAGKSALMEAILSLMPTEERVHYSAMTGQALFYMGEHDLKHKILSIAEEEGATQTAYALKLLQSEGEVSIASTGKNPTTGNLETQEYRVEGPVMLFSTTTAIDIDEELMNRCIVISIDESRTQTKAIHQAQRNSRTLNGLRAKQGKKELIKLHQNVQRLLRPLAVLNPYADQLTFLSDKTRTRRDHEKYLTLIDSIALLHQYQRKAYKDRHNELVTEYIEVTIADIELANSLAHEVLGKTLDELPPQTRRLLQLITKMVKEQNIPQSAYRFSRKTIREYTGLSDGQLKIHCKRLEELEYLLVHAGSRGKAIQYELLYDDNSASNKPHLMGLIDIEALKKTYDDKKLGSNLEKSAPSKGQVRPKSGSSQGAFENKNLVKNSIKSVLTQKTSKNAILEGNSAASHHTQGC